MGCRKGVTMNKKNEELFLGDDDENGAIITLTDEDGSSYDAEIIMALEVDETGKEYVIALPMGGGFEEGEVLPLAYEEDKNGNPVFNVIEDQEEFDMVSELLAQMMENLPEEEVEEDLFQDYLNDVKNMSPGTSLKK